MQNTPPPSAELTDEAAGTIESMLLEMRKFRYSEPARAFAAIEQAMHLAAEFKGSQRAQEYTARLWHLRGILYGEQGRIEEACADFTRGLEYALSVGNRLAEGRCLHGLSIVYSNRGDLDRALSLAYRNLAIRRELADEEGLLAALSVLGSFHGMRGNYTDAAECLIEALRIARVRENRSQEGTILSNLGLLHQECGELDKALDAFARSVAIFEEFSDLIMLPNTLSNWTNALRLAGRLEEARDTGLRALELSRRAGNPHRVITALLNLGAAQSACGEREAAEASLLDALATAEEVNAGRQLTGILMELGRFCLEQGDLPKARRYLEQTRERTARNDEKQDLCNVEKMLSDLCLAEGDGVAALAHYKAHHQAEQALQKQAVQNRLLRESERRLREAQEVARIGWWEYNIATRRLAWSAEVFQLLGFDPAGEPSVEEVACRYHPEDVLRHEQAMAGAIADGTPFAQDLRVLQEDGTLRWVHALGRGIPDAEGRMVYLRGTIQDVTERKQAEQQLREMAQELQRSNVMLKEFTSVASHDLKEPLRKIVAFGGMLRNKLDKLGAVVPPEASDYLNRITAATGRMQALIDGLLELARASQSGSGGRDRRERVDLSQIAADVVSDLEVRLIGTGGQVRVGELPTVLADPLQMRQLLQNLIGNGLKYHREGVPPVVQVECDTGDGRLTLRVSDNGIGFAPEHAQRIFGAFERVAGRGYEGTGVGLAICQRIVEAHGGTITAEGKLGEGATFTVILPLSALSLNATQPHS